MDIVKLLIERLLSWPVVVFLVLLAFRDPLTKLINRMHTFKAGKEGFTIDASIVAANIQGETKVETGLSAGVAEQRLRVVRGFAISPSVTLREQRIRADMQTMNLDVSQQTIDLLIQHLAATQALHAAERVYRTIFGSQIALLKNMNSTPGAIRREVLQAVYDAAKSRFPDLYASYSFQEWLNYLLTNGLVHTEDQLQFSITVDGKEFLKWMTDASVSEDKAF